MSIKGLEIRVGTVVSDKMQKTVVVAITVKKRHPLYGKSRSLTRSYKAHDEAQECRRGDTVRIVQTRPLSKEKRWRVIEIISRKGEVAAVPVVEEVEVVAEAEKVTEAEGEEKGE